MPWPLRLQRRPSTHGSQRGGLARSLPEPLSFPFHLEPLTWAIAEEFVDADGEDLSDHLAIQATFAWHTK